MAHFGTFGLNMPSFKRFTTLPLKKTGMAVAASVALSLSGCSSTTNVGATGVKRKQLLLVSSAQMNALAARQYAKTVDVARSKGKLDTNKRQVRRLQRIADRIIAQVGVFRPDAINWHWEVHTLKSDQINAYVAPGGKIMFYTGIIDKLKLTDNEIAAIMGHEVAHALREHARESASRQVATQMGFGILAQSVGLTGDQAQMANMINQYGFALPHNRRQEREADVLGIELAARAGYNPSAAVSLWQKMRRNKKNGEPPEFMSTHPSSSSRIQKLESLVPTVMPLYQGHQPSSIKRSTKRSTKTRKTKRSTSGHKFKRYEGD